MPWIGGRPCIINGEPFPILFIFRSCPSKAYQRRLGRSSSPDLALRCMQATRASPVATYDEISVPQASMRQVSHEYEITQDPLAALPQVVAAADSLHSICAMGRNPSHCQHPPTWTAPVTSGVCIDMHMVTTAEHYLTEDVN